jgi:hypothetical protein
MLRNKCCFLWSSHFKRLKFSVKGSSNKIVAWKKPPFLRGYGHGILISAQNIVSNKNIRSKSYKSLFLRSRKGRCFYVAVRRAFLSSLGQQTLREKWFCVHATHPPARRREQSWVVVWWGAVRHMAVYLEICESQSRSRSRYIYLSVVSGFSSMRFAVCVFSDLCSVLCVGCWVKEGWDWFIMFL